MTDAERALLATVNGHFHPHEPTPPGPDDPNDEPTDEPALPRSTATAAAAPLPSITITFEGEREAGATVAHTPTVTLGQMMAAAYLLDCIAREIRVASVAQQAQQRLALAGPGMPAPLDLSRLRRNG